MSWAGSSTFSASRLIGPVDHVLAEEPSGIVNLGLARIRAITWSSKRRIAAIEAFASSRSKSQYRPWPGDCAGRAEEVAFVWGEVEARVTVRIGFVGTGTMGTPIALFLIDAGHRLTVCDLRPAATAPLAARGARAVESPFAVAQDSEVVFTSLPGPDEMERAALDPSIGILAGLRRGDAYIDLTTNAPAVAQRVGAACHEKGVDMLDAPVSGRPPGMTVMVGGDEAVFAKYRPLFEAIARNTFYVGATGAGCIAKLVTQYLGYTNFIAALEGLLIGAKAGIDPGILAQIVPFSAGASRTFDNIPRAVLSGTFAAGGTLDIVAKDLDLACDLARAAAAPANLGLLAHDILRRAQAQGWGQQGFPVAARILESMAGLELRAPSGHNAAGYQTDDPRRGE
jgi:3-hydroxyisobutyrate dehydrogenase-like beta-hydroxyacid dehydrogenase